MLPYSGVMLPYFAWFSIFRGDAPIFMGGAPIFRGGDPIAEMVLPNQGGLSLLRQVSGHSMQRHA